MTILETDPLIEKIGGRVERQLLLFNQEGPEWMSNISETYKFCTTFYGKRPVSLEVY